MTELSSQWVLFCLGLGLLVYVGGEMYRRTRGDAFREDLFTIRDGLFDYMWQHDLPYDMPAYRALRDLLNGGILFADELRPFTFVTTLCFISPPRQSENLESLLRAIEDTRTREYFQRVCGITAHRLMRYVFLEGPWGMFFRPMHYILWRYASRAPKPAVTDRLVGELVTLGNRGIPESRELQECYSSTRTR